MIRILGDKDIDKVMKIWLETSKIAHNFIDASYWDNNYEKVKYEYIPMGETYVYEEDKVVKGFICIINSEFIGAIFIENQYREFGIGTKLINYLKDRHDKLTLSVYKENINSVVFYKAKGFKVMAEDFNEETNSIEYLMIYNQDE